MRITITPEQIDNVANMFHLAYGLSKTQMEGLQKAINSLESQWMGMEKNRFYSEFQSSQQVFSSFLTKLQEIELELKDSRPPVPGSGRDAYRGDSGHHQHDCSGGC